MRKERRLTQQGLANFLGLSQAHLSKVERGQGSISAEQLVGLLQKYSLPLSYFLPPQKGADGDAELQNALAHLGGSHLREIAGVPVPERLARPEQAVLEALITAPSARLITALAPVIARQCGQFNLERIAERARSRGIENRLWWIIEGTYLAVGERLKEPHLPRELHRQYQKTFILLERKKRDAPAVQDPTKEDELDRDLISERTVQLVKQDRDKLAGLWHIVTRIKKSDFVQALKDSEKK